MVEGLHQVLADDNSRRDIGPVIVPALMLLALLAAVLAFQTLYGLD